MNKEKTIFLVDTGVEVSLTSSSTPGLVISNLVIKSLLFQ